MREKLGNLLDAVLVLVEHDDFDVTAAVGVVKNIVYQLLVVIDAGIDEYNLVRALLGGGSIGAGVVGLRATAVDIAVDRVGVGIEVAGNQALDATRKQATLLELFEDQLRLLRVIFEYFTHKRFYDHSR